MKWQNGFEKLALFGGSFDPFHLGHQSCVQHLLDQGVFDHIFLIPNYQNPLKKKAPRASTAQRLEVLKKATTRWPSQVHIDDSEIREKTPSYTVKTLRRYKEKYPQNPLFFIMGLDVFGSLGDWHSLDEVLSLTHILVIYRGQRVIPEKLKQFPEKLQPYIRSSILGQIQFKSGKKLTFLKVQTPDISAGQIRERIQRGDNVDSLVGQEVGTYLAKENLYI